MRIDAHLHIWAMAQDECFWIAPGSALDRDYDLTDLRPVLEEVNAVILVQAAPSESHTVRLVDAAQESNGLVRGVVGWVDLAGPDGPERVAAAAALPGVIGLRPMLGFIDDTHWVLGRAVAKSLDAMSGVGLRLDVPARVRHLALLPELAQRHPTLPLVLDHAAKPAITAGWSQSWADGITRVARETPFLCKLSGLLPEAPPGAGTELLRPWVEHLLASFGPDRLMWGSDWPVVEPVGGYRHWQMLARNLVPADFHDAVFGGTAARFYGIG